MNTDWEIAKKEFEAKNFPKYKYIYALINNVNDFLYIGQTINIRDRFSGHKSAAINNYPMLIYCAMREIGINNFLPIILEKISYDLADEREIFWIKTVQTYYPFGYNETYGGQNGAKQTTNYSKKISEALKGRAHSNEHNLKISLSKKGVPRSPILNQQISEKMSKQKIAIYDLQNNLITSVIGYTQALKWIKENTKFKGDKSTLARCLRGDIKTSYGYKWRRI